MHSRMLTFISRYQDVGRDLNRTVTAFNRSIGSFDQRVVPQGRRFSELIAGDEDKFQLPEYDWADTAHFPLYLFKNP